MSGGDFYAAPKIVTVRKAHQGEESGWKGAGR